MFDKPFNINEKSDLSDDLSDNDIIHFRNKLESLKKQDFSLQNDFDKIVSFLTDTEVQSLKLSKLLYCLEFNKELFLNLGIIVESRLTNVANLYIQNNWGNPSNDPNLNIKRELNTFINKSTLGEKSQTIRDINLFYNQELSDLISNRLYIVGSLRNFGGHHKVNEFLEMFVNTPYTRDKEIQDIFYLIRIIQDATNNLIANPPA